jgi:ferredoxin-NADP reductase
MHLRVTGINQGTKSSKTFSFERLDNPLPPFRPGQYINLFLDVDGVMTSRPYSIASSPGAQTLELTVRDNPGGFVAPYILNELLIGDEVVTTGPEGHFYHEPLTDGRDLVFLAGGSGITPFMSMIRYFLTTDAPQPPPEITLIYGSRMADDIIYKDELTRLSAEYPNFKYVSIISEPPPNFDGVTGLLDSSLISRFVPNIEGKTFYICGPNAMYDLCLSALIKLGIPRYRIKREL